MQDKYIILLLVPGVKVTCGLTACTPGSAPGPMLVMSMGKLHLSLHVLDLTHSPICSNSNLKFAPFYDEYGHSVSIYRHFSVSMQYVWRHLPPRLECSTRI